jgi:hypothetical protein
LGKKAKAELVIFDATGDVVHRAYVEDPSAGLRGANLEGLSAPLGQLQVSIYPMRNSTGQVLMARI